MNKKQNRIRESLEKEGRYTEDSNPDDIHIFINEDVRRIKIFKRLDLGERVVEIELKKSEGE